jgi:protein-S-isoprenylcysteine O-methyltransferase Ste14
MLSNRHSALPVLQLDWDLVERVVVTVLFCFMTARLVPAVLANATYLNVLLLVSEGVIVLFVLLRRRTTAISRRTVDWFLGFAGTTAPLLTMPAQGEPVLPIAYCGVLMLWGSVLQLSAKLSLRRSFGVVAANRGVKISGPYCLVRHPMYAGYILTYVGFLLSGPRVWNFCVFGVASGFVVARILAEERMLSQDAAYQSYSTRVRYRLLPFVF